MSDLTIVRALACERFGEERLHPEQETGDRGFARRADTPVVLSTGFGKSLIYIAARLLLREPVVVASPPHRDNLRLSVVTAS